MQTIKILKKPLVKTILATLPLLITATLSHAEELSVTKAAPTSTTQVAVVPFAGATSLANLIASDLTILGKNARSDNLPEQATSRNNIHLELWQAQAIPYVVVGSSTLSGNDALITYDVIDVNSQQVLANVTTKSKNNPQSLAVAGYKIADKINEILTGQKGDFSGKIAYVVSNGLRKNMTSQLVVSDVDGYNPTVIFKIRGTIRSLYPSVDGRHFTFTAKRLDVLALPHIFGVDSGSNAVTDLTPFQANNGSASISPDGSQVLFSSDYNADNMEIFLSSYGSSTPQRLTNNNAQDIAPSWLPDGRSYIFTSDRDGGNNHPNIYRTAVGSNAVQRITSGGYNTSGRVSLDGTKMAFLSGLNQGAVMDLRSGAVTAVNNAGLSEPPNMSPSGKYYIFSSRNAISISLNGKTVNIDPTLYGVPRGTILEPVWLKTAQ